jgi:hypothetical protein
MHNSITALMVARRVSLHLSTMWRTPGSVLSSAYLAGFTRQASGIRVESVVTSLTKQNGRSAFAADEGRDALRQESE